MMSKLTLFNDLIHQLESTDHLVPQDYKYVGTGNPNANILIIGKEAAISKEKGEQLKRECRSNLKQWKEIKDFDQDKINESDWEKYTPLYPYKGQLLKIDNNKNFGTSRTWYNYQKLINLIFRTPDNNKVNFHEKVFITEVNSSASLKTVIAETSSIEFRKKLFRESAFFQSFPVVIIAGVGYFQIDKNRNEIEEVFDVKFKEQKLAEGKKTQPYWIHNSVIQPKLLINTYQLSMNVSDLLLQEISELVHDSKILKDEI